MNTLRNNGGNISLDIWLGFWRCEEEDTFRNQGWEYQFGYLIGRENPQVSQLWNVTLCWCSNDHHLCKCNTHTQYLPQGCNLVFVTVLAIRLWLPNIPIRLMCDVCVPLPLPPWETVGSDGHSHKYNSPAQLLWNKYGLQGQWCGKIHNALKSKQREERRRTGRLGYRLWLMGSTVLRSAPPSTPSTPPGTPSSTPPSSPRSPPPSIPPSTWRSTPPSTSRSTH